MSENLMTKKIEQATAQLHEISAKEPEVCEAIGMVIDHIHKTYSDKYAKGENLGIDTKKMLYDKEKGDAVNTYQMSRYLQRYKTTGTKKSRLLVDMFKCIHYGIFEITRRIHSGELDMNEPAV